jgi:hypothetical protein
MNLGDAFLMGVPPDYQTNHLFFVISDPSKHGGTYVIVNITRDWFRAGQECILGPSDHPWINSTSYVSFTDTLEITPERDQMISALIGTRIIMQNPLTPQTLAKVVAAANNSTAIPLAYKKYL